MEQSDRSDRARPRHMTGRQLPILASLPLPGRAIGNGNGTPEPNVRRDDIPSVADTGACIGGDRIPYPFHSVAGVGRVLPLGRTIRDYPPRVAGKEARPSVARGLCQRNQARPRLLAADNLPPPDSLTPGRRRDCHGEHRPREGGGRGCQDALRGLRITARRQSMSCLCHQGAPYCAQVVRQALGSHLR